MRKLRSLGIVLAGLAAGAVNGLFGAGGGLILVPLLGYSGQLEEEEIFPSSISIILPICFVSLVYRMTDTDLPFTEAAPYLIGSAAGGVLAGIFGERIPAVWLHRVLGILILWGGIRYLC